MADSPNKSSRLQILLDAKDAAAHRIFQLPASEFVRLALDPRSSELIQQGIDQTDRDVETIRGALDLPAEADSIFDDTDIRQVAADASAIRSIRQRYLSPSVPKKRGRKNNEAYNRAYWRIYQHEPSMSQSKAFELMLEEEDYKGNDADYGYRWKAFKQALKYRLRKGREFST